MTTKSRYDVLIIGGLGHIGLPLGIVLADAGLQVALYDLDVSRRSVVADGQMPFLEYDAEPILQRVIGERLHLVPELGAVEEADTLIITIGTPQDEYLNPKLLPVLQLAQQLLPHLRQDHHVILRSTVFPGTSQRLAEFFQGQGLTVHLACCPERITQGYAIRELRMLPQIISGMSDAAVRRSQALFGRLGVSTVVVSVKEAELAKLFSNAWRYIQFAIANQFYMMAAEQGVDFYRVRHAMTHGYARAQDVPTAGFAAGPCLLKDTMQLSAFTRNTFLLGHAAMLVNEGLPAFLVTQLQQRYDLRRETVGILGMAFKAEVDDIRDSLSYKLGKLLRFHGAQVLYSDEFVRDPTFISKEALIDKSSIVIIGAPHSAYRTLSIPPRVHVVDLWNLLRGADELSRHGLQAVADPLVDAVARRA